MVITEAITVLRYSGGGGMCCDMHSSVYSNLATGYITCQCVLPSLS